MRRLTILIACIAVVGCEKTVAEMTYTEKMELVEELAVACEAQGFKRNTDQMGDCLRSEAVREEARRERAAENRAMLGAALAAGSATYANSVPAYQAPVRCYSNTLGGTTSTTCY